MRPILSATAVLTLVGLATCQDYPEVSRLGKNILMLQEVSTPGFTTPKVLYNKVANSSDEPRFTEQLTALGQRQQYIVGGEYRLRYVEEA
jgi:predicted amidohydrolase